MSGFPCEGKEVGCQFVGFTQVECIAHQKSCCFSLGKSHFAKVIGENKNLKEEVDILTKEVVSLKALCAELSAKCVDLESKKSNVGFTKAVASINECIQRKICTFSFSSHQYVDQKLYTCVTCNFVNGLCICASCYENCHKGHFVIAGNYTNGYCDCGVNQTTCCCVLPSQTVKTHDIGYFPNIVECYRNNTCTSKFTNEKYCDQVWYECTTCDLQGSKGCCGTCVNTCHKGHELKKTINHSEFVCNCPSSGECRA